MEHISLNKTSGQDRKDNNDDDLKENESAANEDHEFMFKMHRGLVKIQALIRGHLARVQLKKNLIKK